jgi:hypothetical protein
MTAIASFYLINKNKIEDLKKSAKIQTIKIKHKNFLGYLKSGFKKFKIERKDFFWNFLKENCKKIVDYKWSGYIYLNIFNYLKDKKKINLMNSTYSELEKYIEKERGSSCLVFTDKDKNKYLNKLNPKNYNLNEFDSDYFSEYMQENKDKSKIKIAIKKGIELLYESIKKTDKDNIVFFILG